MQSAHTQTGGKKFMQPNPRCLMLERILPHRNNNYRHHSVEKSATFSSVVKGAVSNGIKTTDISREHRYFGGNQGF